MKPLQIAFVVVAAALLTASAVRAADEGQSTVRLTLDQAIERALATSHRLAEGRARQAGAEAAVESQRVADQPVVSALAGYMRTNHVDEFGITMPTGQVRIIYPDVPDNVRGRIDLQWPIYSFGRLDALERAARAEAQATAHDLAAARHDLTLEVTRAFWAVVTAREAVLVVKQSLERMDASLEDVRNYLAVGLVPPNDVFSMEAQRSRQRMLLIRATNQVEQTLTDLRQLIGLAPDAPIEIEAVLERAVPLITPADVLVTDAIRDRADRRAIEARLESVTERRDAATKGLRPVLGLGAGVDYARPNPRIFPRAAEWNPSWDASISFSWTLWDSGRVRADVAAATAAQTAVRERLAEFDSRLAADVRRSRLDVDSALAAVEATADAVRAATEARRVVNERFAAGVATSTEVLDAQVALLQASLDRTQALAAVRLAEARLDWAIGR